MVLNQYFRFLFFAFFFALLGEYFVQVFIAGKLDSFLSFVLFFNYFVLLSFGFFVIYLFEKFIKRYPLLIAYFIIMIYSVFIEWHLLGNVPSKTNIIAKLGILFFWTAVFMTSYLFSKKSFKILFKDRLFLVYIFLIFIAFILQGKVLNWIVFVFAYFFPFLMAVLRLRNIYSTYTVLLFLAFGLLVYFLANLIYLLA